MLGRLRRLLLGASAATDGGGVTSNESPHSSAGQLSATKHDALTNDWAARNARLVQRQAAVRAPYDLSLAEFKRVIVVALSRYQFANYAAELSNEDVELLWRASEDVSRSTEEALRTVRTAEDSLRGLHHPAVLETCTALRRNYELLLKGQAAGYEEASIVARSNCTCYGAELGLRRVSIPRALAAYEPGSSGAKLLPPPSASCGMSEDPRLCHVSLHFCEPQAAEDSPQLNAILEQVLKVRRPAD